MLKAAWNKVVKGYQCVRQDSDRTLTDILNARIAEAKTGTITKVYVTPHSPRAYVVQVPLTPEQAADYIAAREERLAATQERMAARREKYGLNF